MSHNVRWRSLLRLRLRCPFCRATHLRFVGQKGNVRCTHSNSLRSLLGDLSRYAKRIAEGPMREFPGFSWLGTHRSVFPCGSPAAHREKRQRLLRSLLRLRLRLETYPGTRSGSRKIPCESSPASAGMELTAPFSERITYGSSGEQAISPGFSRRGKCDSRGGESPTLTLQQATACLLSVLSSGSPVVRRTERQRSLALTPTHCVRCLETYPDTRSGSRKVPCESSPASAGMELTAPFSERITYGSSGEQAIFPGFSRHGTHRWRPAYFPWLQPDDPGSCCAFSPLTIISMAW